MIEEAFWEFCDHYLELVKVRSYADEDSPGRRSAIATLQLALRTFLKLFAPYLPYVTEEVWSWRLAETTGQPSIHSAGWPDLDEINRVSAPPEGGAFDAAVEVLGKIRSAKTQARKSLRWPVTDLEVTGSADWQTALRPVLSDVLEAGSVPAAAARLREGTAPEGERFTVHVQLAEEG